MSARIGLSQRGLREVAAGGGGSLAMVALEGRHLYWSLRRLERRGGRAHAARRVAA
ncbi:MAG: hypothetical protein H0U61_14600 [Nocardioidaceae bacterium]|nr:hypothetical protein [Nocardioidaceae bacterium]